MLTEIVDMEEALCAMYTNPEPIHYLLQNLTESIGEINEYQKSVVSNWIGFGHDYPITRGIQLSDDNAAFLSPEIYRDFAQPYAEQLGQRFGGVTLHCCMNYKQNIEVMSHTKHFMGFDPQLAFHSKTDIFPHIQDKGFLRVFWLLDVEEKLTFYRNLIDSSEGICGLMLDIFGSDREETLRLGAAVKDYAVKKGRSRG